MHPLTESERRFLAQVSTKTETVALAGTDAVDVTNYTLPAADYYGFTQDRFVQIFQTAFLNYPELKMVYRESARNFCQAQGMLPGPSKIVASNTKRFSCYGPRDWALSSAQEELAGRCKDYRTVKVFTDMQAFYTVRQVMHPCGLYNVHPAAFCGAYTELFGLRPEAEITCSDLSGRLKQVVEKISPHVQPPSKPTILLPPEAMKQAESRCSELGFKPKTEKYGDCVLRLSK
jgi:hypothetical protein